MKKLFFAFAITSVLVSCTKVITSPNNTNNNTTDSTKTTNLSDESIKSFNCTGVKISGSLMKDKAAISVSATVSYTGGNGKTYIIKTHTSTGVTGLTATLQAGVLANGEGVLTYSITGTPTTSGKASFEISLGGKTCTMNFTVDDVTQTVGKPGSIITDVEGNTYKTVFIGSQQWMGENLKVSKYNDGTAIPNITDDTQWSNLTTGAWSYYNNDSNYDKLYNWYAVNPTTNGNKNVCPIGWHVPTDAEWTVLTDFLGGVTAGGKMKEVGTTSWKNPNTDATNISLFTGLPGGTRYSANGIYYDYGYRGNWWSISEASIKFGSYRKLDFAYCELFVLSCSKRFGFSVRCLKD